MAGLNPLQQRNPIVNPNDGTPTPYFLQQMLLLAEATSLIDRVAVLEDSGLMVLLESQIVDVATTSIDFNEISNSSTDLIIRITGRGTTAATTATVRMQLNGDTGSNYSSDRVNRSGSVQVNSGTYAEVGIVTASTATAGRAGTSIVTIPSFGDLSFDKTFAFNGYVNSGATPLAQYGGGNWANSGAIDSISLFLSAGDWDVGSTVSLYGAG